MRNEISNGKTATVTAPGTTASGAIVEVGALCGVATNPAASGAAVVIALEGEYELPKDNSDISVGNPLVVATGSLTKTVGAAVYYRAIATEAAGVSATTVKALLKTLPIVGS